MSNQQDANDNCSALDLESTRMDLRLKKAQIQQIELQTKRDTPRFALTALSTFLLPLAIAGLGFVQFQLNFSQKSAADQRAEIQKYTEYQLKLIDLSWDAFQSRDPKTVKHTLNDLMHVARGLPGEKKDLLVGLFRSVADDTEYTAEARSQASIALVFGLAPKPTYEVAFYCVDGDTKGCSKAKQAHDLLKPLGAPVDLRRRSPGFFGTCPKYSAEIRYSKDEIDAVEALAALLNSDSSAPDVKLHNVGESKGFISVMYLDHFFRPGCSNNKCCANKQ